MVRNSVGILGFPEDRLAWLLKQVNKNDRIATIQVGDTIYLPVNTEIVEKCFISVNTSPKRISIVSQGDVAFIIFKKDGKKYIAVYYDPLWLTIEKVN